MSIQSKNLLGSYLEKYAENLNKTAVITDENVFHFWKEDLRDFNPIVIPAGERFKNREIKSKIEDELFSRGLGRDSTLIAIGGGVITDLVGFIAATFCRGVDLILIPSSLLGMVDASIGGKVGVNHPKGKNLIGSFYFPKEVMLDLSLLDTLEETHFNDGMVEVIKYGLILDASFLDFITENQHKIVSRDRDVIATIVDRCIDFKEMVVSKDAKEGGLRRILNFGHTLGHALENSLNYTITHGHAVAIGSLFAVKISELLHDLPKGSVQKLKEILQPFQKSLSIPSSVDRKHIWEMLSLDKKSQNQNPRFVLLERFGACKSCNGNYCEEISKELFDQAWDALR